MKKFYLFLLFVTVSCNVFSQTQINLSFIGKDAQSQSIMALDSISVKNITENCDTTLATGTTNEPVAWIIENVTWPVGINEISANNSGEISLNQNYPNPFCGTTNINIYKKYGGPMNLVLSDGSGRKLASYQNKFEKGLHSFSISSPANGVFILTVSDNKDNKSIKIINTGRGQASNGIQYIGQCSGFENGILKSSENSGFTFYLGNEMTFTAHADGYMDQTITDNPTADSTYTFNMTVLNIPDLLTNPVTDVTQTTASCGGYVYSDGGEAITACGVCWNTTGNPTINDNTTTNGAGTGAFNSYLTGLTLNTPYYVRAYATNSAGTAYGEEVTFTTLQPLLTTEADINDTLLFCYSKLYDYNEFLYLFDAVYSNTFPAPDGTWTDIYNHSPLTDNGKILMLWSDAFEIIYKANLVIQSSEIVITDQQTKDQIIAQAKAIRAYLYYNLVNWFGEVPIELGITQGLIPRNTTAEILAYLKQDATVASQMLPMNWPVSDNFRIPQSFAKELLSRAFLFTGSFIEAYSSTQGLINSGMYALNPDPDNFTSAGTEIFWGFEKRNNTVFNDFFNKGSYVPVMRYTETFLITAEASFNTGNTVSAVNYINILNNRRGLPAITTLTSDVLFQHWNTELVKEGNIFTTLKRFGKAISLVASPHRFVVPVPQLFINSNPNLTQNVGY